MFAAPVQPSCQHPRQGDRVVVPGITGLRGCTSDDPEPDVLVVDLE